MYYTDPHTIERLTVLCVDTTRKQAQSLSLLRQVAPSEQGRLSQQGSRLLHHMGHRLVILGEWLEQYGSPQPSY